MSMIRPFAVILAGGEGKRMGGACKALLRLGHQTLIEHIITALEPQCSGIVISVQDKAQTATFVPYPVVIDEEKYGPLSGILAALDWIAALHPLQTSLISVTADAPFLPLNMISKLQDERSETGYAVCCAGGMIQPLHALWPIEKRADLRNYQKQGNRSPGAFLKLQKARSAEWPPPYFLNINTPEDLEIANQAFNRF
jgi:molybdenum cofactor guanylyltransferase